MRTGKKILFLPDAGPDNPFQYMLVDYLRENGFRVELGKKQSLFSVLKAAIKYQPKIIYFDWIHSFLIGERNFFSWIKSITFLFEILLVKYLFKMRIVHTIHNIHNHAQRSLKLEKFFYSWFLRQCDMVRVYSHSTIPKVQEAMNIKIKNYVISPDLPYTLHYTKSASKEEGLSFLKLPNNHFTYLFIGNIKPYKGVEELLDAFSKDVFKNDILIIAGRIQQGDFEVRISEKAKKYSNVFLINRFVKEEELPYYFSVADACIFPFKNIEHSGSVELAMSFKKAVITCNTPLMIPLLKNQTELLFKNHEEIAEKMILSKSMDLKKIGLENYKTIHSTDFSPILNLFKV